jgi:hypothetical protein
MEEYSTIAVVDYHAKVINGKVVEDWQKQLALHIRQKRWWMPAFVWRFLIRLMLVQSERLIKGFGL